MHGSGTPATAEGVAVPRQPTAPEGELPHPGPVVRDLRCGGGRTPRRLLFGAGDLVVVSGLPGSGKSTLMRRTVAGPRIDSHDTRERFAARMPRLLPYLLYRPFVRVAHYAGLYRALHAGESVVVHDCGSQTWVRRWLAREAVRRGRALHLLLLDVDRHTALAGQQERGRGVSRYAFLRHRRSVTALLAAAGTGRPPAGCTTMVLLDRTAADTLRTVAFGG